MKVLYIGLLRVREEWNIHNCLLSESRSAHIIIEPPPQNIMIMLRCMVVSGCRRGTTTAAAARMIFDTLLNFIVDEIEK